MLIIAVELITKAIFQSAFHSGGSDGREAERETKEKEKRESKLIPGLKRISASKACFLLIGLVLT